MNVVLYDDLGNLIEDGTVNALTMIDHAHHKSHEGKHFFYGDFITLASAEVQNYVLVTPNTTTRCHFLFRVAGTLSTDVNFYEGGDRTPTTIQLTYPNNRNIANSQELVIYKGYSAGTTNGVNLHPDGFGSSIAGGSSGVSTREEEFILKANTQYIFEITSNANSNRISTHFDWYEVIPKNL